MRPQPPLLAGASVRFVRILSGRVAGAVISPTSLGRTAPSPQTTPRNLRISAQDFFIAAIPGWPRQLSGFSFWFGAPADFSVLLSIFVFATWPSLTVAPPA